MKTVLHGQKIVRGKYCIGEWPVTSDKLNGKEGGKYNVLFILRSSPSIPEETQEAYDRLEKNPVLRPKCIRKIKQQKNGLSIRGYANWILLLSYVGRDEWKSLGLARDGVAHMPSPWAMLVYVLCLLLCFTPLGPIGLIINIILCIYRYREDRKITVYMNEALDRDDRISLIKRVCSSVVWIICNLVIACFFISFWSNY